MPSIFYFHLYPKLGYLEAKDTHWHSELSSFHLSWFAGRKSAAKLVPRSVEGSSLRHVDTTRVPVWPLPPANRSAFSSSLINIVQQRHRSRDSAIGGSIDAVPPPRSIPSHAGRPAGRDWISITAAERTVTRSSVNFTTTGNK